MLADEVEGGEIAHAVVERRRAHEIGEENRQIGDPEPLLGIEGGVAVKITERLVAEHPVRGQKRSATVHERIHLGIVIQTPGMVLRADLFSTAMRTGPGLT